MEEKLRKKLIDLYNKKAMGSGCCGGYKEYVKPHISHSRLGKVENVKSFYRNMPNEEYIPAHKNKSKYGKIYNVPAEIRHYGKGKMMMDDYYNEYIPAHMSHSKLGKKEMVRGYNRKEPMHYKKMGGRGKGIRSPSAYNIFVGQKIREGYNLSQAAAEWRQMHGLKNGVKKGKGILKLFL
jgi:hypothetical protein